MGEHPSSTRSVETHFETMKDGLSLATPTRHLSLSRSWVVLVRTGKGDGRPGRHYEDVGPSTVDSLDPVPPDTGLASRCSWERERSR